MKRTLLFLSLIAAVITPSISLCMNSDEAPEDVDVTVAQYNAAYRKYANVNTQHKSAVAARKAKLSEQVEIVIKLNEESDKSLDEKAAIITGLNQELAPLSETVKRLEGEVKQAEADLKLARYNTINVDY